MTAAKLSCQPTSSIARGLSDSVTAVAKQQRVPARRGAARQHRDHPRGSHHPGPLDRWPAAGERDVERDDDEHQPEPRSQTEPEHGRDSQDESAQQHHVLPAGGHEVRQPGRAELAARAIGERGVVAERHAAQHRALRRRYSRAQGGLRTRAHGVDEPGEPSPRGSRVGQGVGAQQGVNAT